MNGSFYYQGIYITWEKPRQGDFIVSTPLDEPRAEQLVKDEDFLQTLELEWIQQIELQELEDRYANP